MAVLNLDSELAVEVDDSSLADFCHGIAREAFAERGLEPEDDEGLFDDLRYDAVEPALLKAVEDAVDAAVAAFPRGADAWAEQMPDAGRRRGGGRTR